MKIFQNILLLCLCFAMLYAKGQKAFHNDSFFADQTMLNITLTTDIGNLVSGKIKESTQAAIFTCRLQDSSTINEEIKINARGNVRRAICYMPPLKFDFHNKTSPTLYPLNTLKLVCSCKPRNDYQQLLLKEYLVYRMFNLLTEKSFRVRLANITYEDSKGRKNTSTSYAFFVEDIDELAKRNHGKEWNKGKIATENTNRKQMTLVSIFQYMIGNTDWSVRQPHNIKLIYTKKDSIQRPYAIPYDFDYAGIVNADYAVPQPELGIESVRERVYRGFPRTMEELQEVTEVFLQQKEHIYALVEDFELLDNRNKKEMLWYLDDFYKIIGDSAEIKFRFINNARAQ